MMPEIFGLFANGVFGIGVDGLVEAVENVLWRVSKISESSRNCLFKRFLQPKSSIRPIRKPCLQVGKIKLLLYHN